MTDQAAITSAAPDGAHQRRARLDARRAARRRAEARFRLYGIAAILVAVGALAILVVSVMQTGLAAFRQHAVTISVEAREDLIFATDERDEAALQFGSYGALARLFLSERFPGVTEPRDLRELYKLLNPFAGLDLRDEILEDPSRLGGRITVTTPASDDVDQFFKREARAVTEIGGSGALAIDSGDPYGRPIARGDTVTLRIDGDTWGAFGVQISTDEQAANAGPSHLVEAAGGVFKLQGLSGASAKATTLIPPDAEAIKGPSSESGVGPWRIAQILSAESERRLSDDQIAWARALRAQGSLKPVFNSWLFVNADSREPEIAGLAGAVRGSLLVMAVTLAFAFPIGVATAIYLEEYAPRNGLTDFIEVNINNLAAVPSIIFGLLGLSVLLNVFGLPRSASLVGGLVLGLMTLPTIIIASRSALKAVPPSIREAAIGVGASRTQAVFHHVLPLALPGMLTGAILGMARALGETAPLLMIGMVAFIADPPTNFTDPAAVLPVQIFLWADGAERAFYERSSAAILALLGFLVLMNLAATLLRARFERKW